jgi:integrase
MYRDGRGPRGAHDPEGSHVALQRFPGCGRRRHHRQEPAHRIDLDAILGPEVEREGRALTLEEVHALAGQISERYYARVMLLAYAGMRISETAGLRVKRVDLDERCIDVCVQALVLSSGRQSFDQPSKGQNSKRDIWIGPGLTGILAEHIAKLSDPGEPEAFVFTTSSGTPIRRDGFLSKHLKLALRAIGLSDVTTHDLRHTADSLMRSVGYEDVDRQRRMGHAPQLEMDRRYLCPYADHQRELAAKLDPKPHQSWIDAVAIGNEPKTLAEGAG